MEAIVRELFEAVRRKKMSDSQLSKMSGVNQPYIGLLRKGLNNPTIKVLNKLNKALNLDLVIVKSKDKKEVEAYIRSIGNKHHIY